MRFFLMSIICFVCDILTTTYWSIVRNHLVRKKNEMFFFFDWKTMIYTSSKREFDELWKRFFIVYVSHEHCVKYLTSIYIRDFRRRFLTSSVFRETATKKRFGCRGDRQHWGTFVSSFELRYCWRLHWYSSVIHILVVAYIDQQSFHFKNCRLHFLTYVIFIIAVAYIEMKRRTLIYDYVEY
jgi:hypothetical protein